MWQPSVLPALIQSLFSRYFLLFLIGVVGTVLLPLGSNFLTAADRFSSAQVPAVQIIQTNPTSTAIAQTNFPVSLTHQEPNFY